MHYQQALEKIRGCYTYSYGSFYEPLPDLETLPPHEAQEITLGRAREMWGIIRANEIGYNEFSRFTIELDIVCLLTIVCIRGASSEEIQLTQEDIETVGADVERCRRAFPQEEEENNISHVMIKLTKGIHPNELPEELKYLLSD